jgi:hypothetical protein
MFDLISGRLPLRPVHEHAGREGRQPRVCRQAVGILFHLRTLSVHQFARRSPEVC